MISNVYENETNQTIRCNHGFPQKNYKHKYCIVVNRSDFATAGFLQYLQLRNTF